MLNVCIGENLHEMSKPVFWENKKKYFNMSSAENLTQSAKCDVMLPFIALDNIFFVVFFLSAKRC